MNPAPMVRRSPSPSPRSRSPSPARPLLSEEDDMQAERRKGRSVSHHLLPESRQSRERQKQGGSFSHNHSGPHQTYGSLSAEIHGPADVIPLIKPKAVEVAAEPNDGETAQPPETAPKLEDLANIEVVPPTNVETPAPNVNSVNMPPPLTRAPSYYTPAMEDTLRRRLKFFFMDPCDKFRARRRIPWKLLFQVVKIALVTAQVIVFGHQRSNVVEYFQTNAMSLKHVLLRNWDPSYETMPYPPATGQYAVYTQDDLYASLSFFLEQYNNITNVTLGTMLMDENGSQTVPPPPRMCVTNFKYAKLFPNGTFRLDPTTTHECRSLVPLNGTDGPDYDMQRILAANNWTIDLVRLVRIDLDFSFRSYHFEMASDYESACFKVDTTIAIDNHQRNGQMLVTLDTDVKEIKCDGFITSEDAESAEQAKKNQMVAFDSSVIVVCVVSFCLCLRSLYRGFQLHRATVKFFKKRYGKTLSCSDQMEFLNLWYLLIVLNDILTVIGSAFKIQLESRKFNSSSDNLNVGSLLLGVGVLFAWTGVLRYLGFFRKYNVLIMTLKRAFPHVLRFMVCVMCLYAGFLLCGWVVLAPYHIKFRSISTASECLFSLVNGDDMFVTFSATVTENMGIWYFSRIYLYVFISLFIYVVLSLCVAIILDTFETLKKYYEEGFPETDLSKFMNECDDSPHSPLYSWEKRGCNILSCICCCQTNDDHVDERTNLLGRFHAH